MKPTLRNSELLYNFLTQPDDFTLPNGEIILCKFRGFSFRLNLLRFCFSENVQSCTTSITD